MAAFVGTTLRAFVETGLPDLPAPAHLHSLICTQPPCARSPRAQWTFLWSTLGRFTEYGEDALQRLTAGSTRPTGPLLVASPSHRWGILAAMEQPDKWVTDEKRQLGSSATFFACIFLSASMATLDMHGELCTWRPIHPPAAFRKCRRPSAHCLWSAVERSQSTASCYLNLVHAF